MAEDVVRIAHAAQKRYLNTPTDANLEQWLSCLEYLATFPLDTEQHAWLLTSLERMLRLSGESSLRPRIDLTLEKAFDEKLPLPPKVPK